MTALVLIPGLGCSARLYEPQIPALWQLGPVQVARHTAADSMSGIAEAILAEAPPRFHLAGLSMGGYIAFEILRQAPGRVVRLALLDTAARADTPEQTARRQKLILAAQENRLELINELLWPLLVPNAGQKTVNCAALSMPCSSMSAPRRSSASRRR